MDFNYQAPPITPYIPHPPLSGWGYNGSYHLEGPNSAIEMSQFLRTEMERAKVREEIMMESVWTQIQKERIREEIIVDEIVTRRLLEAEVRRELSIEKALAFHRGDDLFIDPRGFHAPLSPLQVSERPTGERFVTSREGWLGEGEGRPVGERYVTSREGLLVEGEGRTVGERFATSHDGRVVLPSVLRRQVGGFGTGLSTTVEPHLSETKLPLWNGKQKEKIILPAKPLQDVNTCVLPSTGSAKKQLREVWSCALCQVSASSEQGLDEHLQGKMHKGKAAGLRKKANKFKIGWFTEKAPIVSVKDAPSMSSKVSKKSYQTIAKSLESGSQSQDSHNTKRKDYSFDDSGNNNEAMVMQRKNSLGKKDNKCKGWQETCKVGGTSKVIKEHGTEIECGGQLQISNQNGQVMAGVEESTVTKTDDNDAENSVSEDLRDVVPALDLEDLSDLVRKVELESHQEKESNADAKMSSLNSEKSGGLLLLSHQLDDFERNSGTPIVRTQEHKKNSLKFWCEMCQIGTDTEKVMKIHRTGKKHLAHKKSLLRFWCDVCQIGADTEEVMEMHWRGKKHLSQFQQINQQPGDEACKLAMQPIQDSEANSQDTRDNCNLLKNKSRFSVESMTKNGAPFQRINVTQGLKKNSLKFWCGMCQIGTNTEEVMNIHRTGKKHLANKKSLARFWCDVCQIGADTEEVMGKHLKGNKHLSRLQQINQMPGDEALKSLMQPVQYAEANTMDTRNGYNQ